MLIYTGKFYYMLQAASIEKIVFKSEKSGTRVLK